MKRRATEISTPGRRRARLFTTAFASVVVAVGFHGAVVQAADGEAYVLADAQCSPDVQGVLDLTLVNDSGAAATFELTLPGGAAPATIVVAPAEAYAVTYTGLADGLVVVPITLDGADATATAQVACSEPRVESLAGSQRAAGAFADDSSLWLPATGSSSGGLLIGSVMVAAGMAASLISRRRAS